MIDLSRRRLAALLVVAGTVLLIGCWPRVNPYPEWSLTRSEEDAISAAAIWTGCSTIQRAAAGGGTTSVTICAETNARTYGPRRAPGRPVLVARMTNAADGAIENRWGLLPGEEYKIWLQRDLAGRSLYAIKGPGIPIFMGLYRGCGHQEAPVSRANFGTCNENPTAVAGAGSTESNVGSGPFSHDEHGDKEAHTLLDRSTGPAWVSCTEGCCMTGELEFQ